MWGIAGSIFAPSEASAAGRFFLKGAPRLLVANRFMSPGQANDGGGASNSNYTRGESRHVFYTPNADVYYHQVAWGNWKTAGGNGEVNGSNNILRASALETQGGQVIQYTYNGSAAPATVVPGATIWSDPHPTPLLANTAYYMRDSVTVNSGETFPQTNSQWASSENGYNSTAASSQLLNTGILNLPPGGASNNASIMPFALKGVTMRNGVPVRVKSFFGLGDSIIWGTGNTSDGFGNLGYAREGMFRHGQSGSVPPQFNGYIPGDKILSENAVLGAKKRTFMPLATAFLGELGDNDFSDTPSLAALQRGVQEILQASINAGHTERYWTKLTPKTSSSNNFIDAAGQSYYSARFAPGGDRDLFNAWLDTLIGTYLTGTVNPNTAVEDQSAPCKWASNGTPFWLTIDGTHTSDAGKSLISPLISAISA